MFENKRKYYQDQINKWVLSKKRISKTKLSKKLGISRVTLNKLLKTFCNKDFTQFGRNYANNKISEVIRQKLFNNTIDFLEKINSHRKETTFIPTFVTLKPYIDQENEVSMRTYQNIIKENNFYLPSCTRATKKKIRRRIKLNETEKKHTDILEKMEEIKIQRKYTRKYFPFGDTVEIDACEHAWFGDEKCHLYRAVDAGSGKVLVEHVEKEETSMGYIVLLKKLLKTYGKPRLIVTDKRKSFWNGHENKSQISLILSDLDIDIITSSEPTAKPNVERSFHDSQQWLPLELFEQKIFSIKKFKMKIDVLTTKHNQRFHKKQTSESSFTTITNKEIESKLRLWIYRKVTNGNTLSINGQHYIPVKNGKRILFQDNIKVQVCSNEKINYFVIWRNEQIKLQILADKYVVDYHSKEWNKIAFEKRKQQSANKMIDIKQIKLEKQELAIRKLIAQIRKEKNQLNGL